MEISFEQIRGVQVVRPSGSIDGSAAGEFREELLRLVAEQQHWFVVDLSQVERMDSKAIRALLMLSRKAAPPSGGLILCGMGEQVRRGLELAKLSKQFAACDALDDAVRQLEEEQKAAELSKSVAELLREAETREEADQEGR